MQQRESLPLPPLPPPHPPPNRCLSYPKPWGKKQQKKKTQQQLSQSAAAQTQSSAGAAGCCGVHDTTQRLQQHQQQPQVSCTQHCTAICRMTRQDDRKKVFASRYSVILLKGAPPLSLLMFVTCDPPLPTTAHTKN